MLQRMQHTMSRLLNALAAVTLVTWQVFWLAQPINFATADLPRHLTNGRLLVESWREHGEAVLVANHYSYTAPDFPWLNHHWGSGVVFYLVERGLGMLGMHVVFVAVNVLTLLVFFMIARQGASLPAAWLSGMVLMPLIGARAEVRPEVFSYLLAGVYWWLLSAYRRGRLQHRMLLVLPVLQVVWVNLHVYFFAGLGIAAAFWLPYVAADVRRWRPRRWSVAAQTRWLGLVLMLMVLACALNPAGIRMLSYPWHVAHNYGYPIVENKSVPWLMQWGMDWPNFQLLRLLGWILLALAFWKWRRWRLVPLEILLATGGWAAAYMAVRNFSLAGLFTWPLLAFYLTSASEDAARILPRAARRQGGALVAVAAVLLVYFQQFEAIRQQRQQLGLGLAAGVNGAAEFITAHDLRGPLFNNYDNGGYLIYHFFPRERVFVDNRPEAYPAAFFREVYIPMQQDEAVWREQLGHYQFRGIVFYRHDLTEWGQQFLAARSRDPDWAIAYTDAYHVIFTRTAETPLD